MGTWGVENFDNDGARDYLSMLQARLVGAIQEVIADDDRLSPEEDGETLLMPSVELLALLCERYNTDPPRPATVRQWHEKYLAAFDAAIDRLRPKPGYKAARRKVIENTFRWLEGVAEAFWDQ